MVFINLKSQIKVTNEETCVTTTAENKNDTNSNTNHLRITRRQSAQS